MGEPQTSCCVRKSLANMSEAQGAGIIIPRVEGGEVGGASAAEGGPGGRRSGGNGRRGAKVPVRVGRPAVGRRSWSPSSA